MFIYKSYAQHDLYLVGHPNRNFLFFFSQVVSQVVLCYRLSFTGNLGYVSLFDLITLITPLNSLFFHLPTREVFLFCILFVTVCITCVESQWTRLFTNCKDETIDNPIWSSISFIHYFNFSMQSERFYRFKNRIFRFWENVTISGKMFREFMFFFLNLFGVLQIHYRVNVKYL